jgi:hypothetical protein
MSNILKVGDLAVVIAVIDDSTFEFPNIMEGDIVEVVSIVPRWVLSSRVPDAPHVWSDCDVKAADGTVWPAQFKSLRKIKPGKRGSWEKIKKFTGWSRPVGINS